MIYGAWKASPAGSAQQDLWALRYYCFADIRKEENAKNLGRAAAAAFESHGLTREQFCQCVNEVTVDQAPSKRAVWESATDALRDPGMKKFCGQLLEQELAKNSKKSKRSLGSRKGLKPVDQLSFAELVAELAREFNMFDLLEI